LKAEMKDFAIVTVSDDGPCFGCHCDIWVRLNAGFGHVGGSYVNDTGLDGGTD
jgi:hypothetical protein